MKCTLPELALGEIGPNQKAKKSAERGIRTHAAQKEGCAERIAPIGTLSQNGYGEDLGTHKRTMGKPDVIPPMRKRRF